MAEAESGGSWWSSMIIAAKEKSVSALTATKRDLAEFVSVLSNDTSVAVKHAGMNIKELIQNENVDESEGGRVPLSHPPLSTISPSSPSLGVPYDRSQAQLFALQSSSHTYTTNPRGVEAEYEAWTKEFDVQSRQSEISQLLVNCPHVRTMHGRLVPASVSYERFWQRYFFKLGLLEQEERRRADLMARVQPQQQQADLQWEELEEGDGGGEEAGQRGEHGTQGDTEKSKERPNKEADDLVEVGSSIVDIKSEHLRSESSDSFVCVSEDLPHSERSRMSPNGNGMVGDWEYLKMAEVGEEEEEGDDGEIATPVKREGGHDYGDVPGERGEEGRGGENKEGSESSDWESWND